MLLQAKIKPSWIVLLIMLKRWIPCLCGAPPQIAPFRVLENLVEGQRLSLMCSVTIGTPPIAFSWTKDSNPVALLPSVKVALVDDDQEQLKIEKLSSDHVGNYTCAAKNAFGSDQMSVSVVLNFRPHWVNNESKVINAVAGEQLKLNCEAIGHPHATIKISKGMFVRVVFS